MVTAEYVRLDGMVSVKSGSWVLQLRLHYRWPDGQEWTLNGPEMSWSDSNFIPRAESLDHVAKAFLEDAAYDLALEGVTLDSDEPRDGFVMAYDSDARALLGLGE
jgi:hypothetical protein